MKYKTATHLFASGTIMMLMGLFLIPFLLAYSMPIIFVGMTCVFVAFLYREE